MRRLLQFAVLLAALAWCASAHAQTFVHAVSAEGTSVTNVTDSITTSNGSAVIVMCRQDTNNTDTATISDSASQSYTQTASGYKDDATNDRVGVWYIANSAALTNVKCTWTGTAKGRIDVTAYEVSGMATSSLRTAQSPNTKSYRPLNRA